MNKASRIRVHQKLWSVVPNVVVRLVGNSKRPTDPFRIADALGIKTVRVQLHHGCGRLFRTDDRWLMLIPDAVPHERQRFSCAHELGHYILSTYDHDLLDDVIERIDGTYDPREVEEMFCNIFAKELLMPSVEMRSHLLTGSMSMRQFWRLRKRYDCSLQATAIRVTELTENYAFVMAKVAEAGSSKGLLTVLWSAAPPSIFIPHHKVINSSSSIGRAFSENKPIKDYETDPFGGRLKGVHRIEAWPLDRWSAVFAIVKLRAAQQLELPLHQNRTAVETTCVETITVS